MNGQVCRLVLWSIILISLVTGCADDTGKPAESPPSPNTSAFALSATSAPAPSATSTPALPATSIPAPLDTSTPAPSATSTPAPLDTSTPAPSATSTPAPSATSTPAPPDRPALNIQFIGAADLSDERKTSLADLVESIQAGVVQITTSTNSGSGFIINADGLVVTNEHVVSGESSVRVWLPTDAAITLMCWSETRLPTLRWYRYTTAEAFMPSRLETRIAYAWATRCLRLASRWLIGLAQT